MKTYEFDIDGMTCDNCALSITRKLDIKGIEEKSVSYADGKAIVVLDEDKISAQDVKNQIDNNTHYKVTSFQEIISNKQDKHLIIIGGGSAAFAATLQAREYGAKVTMINEGLPIGGTCVNVGCVPSKNLIRAANSLYSANNNAFKGISSLAKVSDFSQIIRGEQELVTELREQKYINIIKDMKDFKLIKGRATLVSNTSVKVNGHVISGTHVLIATGASPAIPNIEGLNKVDYLTNEEVFALEELPKSMTILGGSFIALEIAQMFSRFGTKVTLLQRSNHILSSENEDISQGLHKYLEQEGIKVVVGNDIRDVKKENENVIVHSIVNGKDTYFKAQKIVLATGRVANTENLNLESIGIAVEKNSAIKVDKFLQTNLTNISAAGDVLGSNMFVYTAAYEGKLAVDNAFSAVKKAADYSVLPWVVFTDPQVAGVGLDEAQAKARGIDYEVAILPLSYVPRAIAANETKGFIKLLRNRGDDTLIGARILATEGSELLMEVSIAIRFGIKVSELKEMLHPYLTLCEGIKLAAITFSKDVKELSCCAT